MCGENQNDNAIALYSSAAGTGAIWNMNHSIAGFPTSSFAIGTYRIISHHKSHHLSVSASSILTTANVQNGRNGVGWQHSLIYPGYNRVCGYSEYIVYSVSHGTFKWIFVVILCLLLSKKVVYQQKWPLKSKREWQNLIWRMLEFLKFNGSLE